MDSKVDPTINPTQSANMDDKLAHSESDSSRQEVPTSTNPLDNPEFAHINEKKLMRKVDFRVVPWLSVLYLLSFLDRSAIGNAKLYGLANTIHASDSQINIAVSMFFITYAVFEIPSNVLLKRLRPKVWFSLITVLVGIAMAMQGVVNNYPALTGVRVVLGAVEAGLFPGANYLLSGWYKRSEFGLSVLQCCYSVIAYLIGAFGGLLSSAIHNMNGIGGYEGWRWIFIIIGLATFVAGLASYWLVSDFPETASFLDETEKKFVVARLQTDQKHSAAGEGLNWRPIIQCFLDWKTWVGSIAYMGCDGALYSFSLFTPTIVKALGYSSTRANLISVPIYVIACIATIGIGFIADKKGNRALINLACSAVGVVGYIVLIASRNAGVSYAFIYLAALGIYPCIPNTIALTSTGVEGTYKRGAVMAYIISFGNLNGAATTNFYRTQYGPWYSVSHGLVLMYILLGMIATTTFLLGVKYENRKRERGLCNETILVSKDASAQEVENAITEAARIRKEERQALLDKGGLMNKIKALYYSVDMRDGGTYATSDEAKELKGDYYSGFRYSY